MIMALLGVVVILRIMMFSTSYLIKKKKKNIEAIHQEVITIGKGSLNKEVQQGESSCNPKITCMVCWTSFAKCKTPAMGA